MYAVTTERTIAMAILAIVVVAWASYLFVNIRQSKGARGSEMELAPNRAVPPDDEELEGSRLEKVQAWGVLFLLITAVVLPLYWVREGGRRAGAERGFESRAVSQGEGLFVANCSSCHGVDLGGSTFPSVVLDIGAQFDDVDTFLVDGNWAAPRLTDVFLRFDTEIADWKESTEVLQILTYGRGVMPAWGVKGGGAMNDQQVESLVAYLWSEQDFLNADRLSDEQLIEARDLELSPEAYAAKILPFRRADELKEAEMARVGNESKSEGQVLFELHCARCHTPQWPASRTAQLPNNGGTVQVLPGPAGAGRYGPALNSVSLARLFPDIDDHITFVATGAADNVAYGERARVGNYGMPGFGRVLTEDEIRAVAEYERSLDPAEQEAVGFDDLLEREEENS